MRAGRPRKTDVRAIDAGKLNRAARLQDLRERLRRTQLSVSRLEAEVAANPRASNGRANLNQMKQAVVILEHEIMKVEARG
ncbi:hypothetical protein [Ancylobacter vacuolatus]|uniref:Uncharacterized protein n=1 Tax=Ancylobacter vacuolatus TaxID=223389 RepID=A0ABU0DHE8_9HYPH|nr:hypothetical protein [Ancylobacter vacuolatus]MDQ0347850.1 hypothetical protein [Ancylobacter vacuolatus]